MPTITILNGEEVGKKYEWTADRIRIGRNSANDFVIADHSVSGQHCLIERSEGGWRIKDLDSTNGTRINASRVTMAMLHREDVISFGDVEGTINGDDVPSREPSTNEPFESIPRTTIVMRPKDKTATTPAAGFTKKSESKKALNAIIGTVITVIVIVAAVLLLKIFKVL